jgi:hypothetical protein
MNVDGTSAGRPCVDVTKFIAQRGRRAEELAVTELYLKLSSVVEINNARPKRK